MTLHLGADALRIADDVEILGASRCCGAVVTGEGLLRIYEMGILTEQIRGESKKREFM